MAAESLHGVVSRVQWSSKASGWAVIKVRSGGREETAVGELASVAVGDSVEISGSWTEHAQFGRQMKAADWKLVRPKGTRGVMAYLAKTPGVGEETANAIVAHLGEGCLETIALNPDALLGVPGVGAKRAAAIREAVVSQTEADRVLIEMQRIAGVTPRIAAMVVEHCAEAKLGDPIVYLREHPYDLVEIHGVGFKTADEIALSLGISANSASRIRAGITSAMGDAMRSGHCAMTTSGLARSAGVLLGVPQAVVKDQVESMILDGKLVREYELLFLPEFAHMEREVAIRLVAMTQSEVDAISMVEPEGIDLSPEQEAAIGKLLRHRFAILTGGPGTGKTTITRTLLRSLTAAGENFLLVSPTGRAAKRLEEATGFSAQTIHRALGYSGKNGTWAFNRHNLIAERTVVVDEASMVDLALFWRLLDAMPEDSRLYLVGDADQLPSVGPGRVLRDLIESGQVPVSRLSTIFRQAMGSKIILAAHGIQNGEVPDEPGVPGQDDLFLVTGEDPQALQDAVVAMVAERIPAAFRIPSEEVQVIVPMHRGVLGTTEINKRLQERLNPHGRKVKGTQVKVGDRVMQTRNNYRLEAFNGEVGMVRQWDEDQGVLRIDFGDRSIWYQEKDLGDLALAYACSIHKSQGSEYPAVVLVLAKQHTVMLQRTLFYTGLTRASRVAILVGDDWSFRTAARRAGGDERKTALGWRMGRSEQKSLF